MSQRLRITFSAVGPLKYVAHLDMMRTWERAIRRSGLPLAYTQGFSPHARIALASPLPVGVVGLRELMDVWLDPPAEPAEAARRLRGAMPPGLDIVEVEEVSNALPSLQSSLRSARYEVLLPAARGEAAAVRERVDALLALETLDWEEERGDRTRRYDLRATIDAIAAKERNALLLLTMDLSLAEGRTGRPAQVLRALGLDPDALEVVRTLVRTRAPAETRASSGRNGVEP
ncbi:MAG: DUF2344 domain-containing protein [Chloroflexi bacterium]|nr:DUF2344 domain-containing protein [Chloroflexota bacterium]